MVQVLMQVRLIGLTQPASDIGAHDASELLAYCARVSSAANQEKHDTGWKLLKSLVRRQEWSPFEMVSMTVEITTTRDIGRQILRHRSFSFQEFSQRYAVVEDEFIARELRFQDNKDRQNSHEAGDIHHGEKALWAQMQRQVFDLAHAYYTRALAIGVAKEQARALLPEGLTPTRMYMAGTLRSWLHYVMLRDDRKTQKEHRLIAGQVRAILYEQIPALRDVL